MRIKKYENWKFCTNNRPNTTCSKTQKMSDIFSISQLLQTPKKTSFHQGEHQYIFTDPKAINHPLTLNRPNFSKTDIQINFFVRPQNQSLREQNIKNKIKLRIKEQFSLSSITPPNSSFLNQGPYHRLPSTSNEQLKTQPKEGRVYVKGNSLALSSVDQKKRSKSSFIQTSLPNFNKKSKFSQMEQIKLYRQETKAKAKLSIVELKRKLSSSLGTREQKSVSWLNRKNSLKEIEPWQTDEGPQIFEL